MRPNLRAAWGVLLAGGLALGGSGCAVFLPSAARAYRLGVEKGPYDVVIVPGFPSGDGTWNRAIKARVYWSKHLFDEGIARHIIYSGAAVYSPYVESRLMALYAEALGVPREVIHLETRAEFSAENLYYSVALARRLGYRRIAVTTDPFHHGKLERLARKLGLEVTFLPVQFDRLLRMEKKDPEIPGDQALDPDYVPIEVRYSREDRARGTRGERIVRDPVMESPPPAAEAPRPPPGDGAARPDQK